MEQDPNESLYQELKALSAFFNKPTMDDRLRRKTYLNAIKGMKDWRKEHPGGRFTKEDVRRMAKSKKDGGAQGVGQKLTAKLLHWIDTYDEATGKGQIKQLEKFREAQDDPEGLDKVFAQYGLQTLSPRQKLAHALTSIPYVGPATANAILKAMQRHEGLDPVDKYDTDTILSGAKLFLTSVAGEDILDEKQKISLKHLDKTSRRMERSFVTLIGSCFSFILEQAYGEPSRDTWELTIGGSYFRGMPDSGDLDVILYVPSRLFEIDEAVRLLKRFGFIIEEFSKGKTKFLGLGTCPGSPGDRVFKVDILYVSEPSEKSFALLHYTLGKEANTRLRLEAKRAGMKLEQTGLWRKTKMKGSKPDQQWSRVDLGVPLESLSPSELEEIISKAITERGS